MKTPMNPISLVVVTDGTKIDSLERTIKSARDIVSEVIIVYQGNNDEALAACNRLSDFCWQTTPKGNADPDRNFAYTLATQPWILSMDDDEWLPIETQKFITRIIMSATDVVWFKFRNLINGTDVKEILGDDPHPRLWRRMDGLIQWPTAAHQFPQIASPKQFFTAQCFVHDRKFEDILKRHEARVKVIDPQNQELEKRFIAAVKSKLGIQ